jgi:hypothetical protein
MSDGIDEKYHPDLELSKMNVRYYFMQSRPNLRYSLVFFRGRKKTLTFQTPIRYEIKKMSGEKKMVNFIAFAICFACGRFFCYFRSVQPVA